MSVHWRLVLKRFLPPACQALKAPHSHQSKAAPRRLLRHNQRRQSPFSRMQCSVHNVQRSVQCPVHIHNMQRSVAVWRSMVQYPIGESRPSTLAILALSFLLGGVQPTCLHQIPRLSIRTEALMTTRYQWYPSYTCQWYKWYQSYQYFLVTMSQLP